MSAMLTYLKAIDTSGKSFSGGCRAVGKGTDSRYPVHCGALATRIEKHWRPAWVVRTLKGASMALILAGPKPKKAE